jgi:hypothetical protein
MKTQRLQKDVMSTFEPVLFEGLRHFIKCNHIKKNLQNLLLHYCSKENIPKFVLRYKNTVSTVFLVTPVN